MSAILSVENQKMIFEVLSTISKEDNLIIDQDNLKKFIFQRSVNLYESNKANIDNKLINIIQLNKEIIKSSHDYILSRQGTLRSHVNVKKAELNQEYNLNLKKHEDDLNSYTKPPMENISFEDEKDEPIDNMKTMLSDAMLQREKELSMITGNFNNESSQKAISWLNMESGANNDVPLIKIGELITNNDDDDKKLKPIILDKKAQLTKQDNEKIKNLFSKLKPAKVTFKENNNDETNMELKSEMKELKSDMTELKSDMTELKDILTKLQDDFKKMQSNIIELPNEVNDANKNEL